MVLTMIISVPAAILFLNWLGTLWRGRDAPDDADAVRARAWCSSSASAA